MLKKHVGVSVTEFINKKKMVRNKILHTENSRTLLTVSEKVESESSKFPQFLASALATLSALSAGMCLTWTSAAIPMLQTPEADPKVSNEEAAWIASILTLGACVGAIPTGALTNSLGPKRTLQLLSLPLLSSWIIIAYGQSVVAYYVARFVAGLAVGSVSVAAPMYVAELAHTSIRGTLGTFYQVQVTIGLLLQYILGGTITNFTSLALASSLLPIVFLISFSFMPETPVYLCTKGRMDDARKSLTYFRGCADNLDEEMSRIREDIKMATMNKTSITDLIACRATMRGMVVSLGLMVFQQLSGINAVLFYTGNIFAETGSSMSPNACAVLVGVVQVISTLLATLLIDKAGRKILLFVSALVMCMCLISLGVYFHLKQHHDLAYLSILPLVCLALYIVVFSIGFGPIPWMMMGEIFSPKSRGIASSISAAANWILGFTVTNQFQNLISYFGMGITFIIFGCICGLGVIFVSLLVPETKGKDINQVQNVLLRNTLVNCMVCCLRRTRSLVL